MQVSGGQGVGLGVRRRAGDKGEGVERGVSARVAGVEERGIGALLEGVGERGDSLEGVGDKGIGERAAAEER